MTIADNTFGTPLNQRPLDLGIDLVFHSGTKYFGGHSDLIAGAVMGSAALIEKLGRKRRPRWHLAPFNAWLMFARAAHASLRVRQHNENALALAQFLEKHPAVKSVRYPGLPSHRQHELARSR